MKCAFVCLGVGGLAALSLILAAVSTESLATQSNDPDAAPVAAQSAVTRPAATQPAPSAVTTAGYHTYEQLTNALRELASSAGGAAQLASIAATSGRRDVWLLQLAAKGDVPVEERQAILFVGGVDAEHVAGSETALRVAAKLIEELHSRPDGDVAKVLQRRVVFIVPRANPDGIEAFFATPRNETRLNATPIDDDRDGRADEDPPNDLNGDGVISVMRVRDLEGEWMVDPEESRLMKRADRTKGERGAFKLILEGIDDDGDDEINEDSIGGVDEDRNWPHFFEPGVKAAGIHQLCEPGMRALAEFVFAHPNITAAVVYGRHDNIVTVPKGDRRGPDGQSYRDLHPDDTKLYEFISEKYKKATGLKASAGARPEGALYAWLYSQRGIPTIATNVWWPVAPPEPGRPATQPATPGATQPATGPATQAAATAPTAETQPVAPPVEAEAAPETAARSEPEQPPESRGRGGGRRSREEMREMFRQMRESGGPGGPPGGRGGGRRGAGPPDQTGPGAPPGALPPGAAPPTGEPREREPAAADPLAARAESTDVNKRWLKYSDEKRGGGGFLPWSEIDHPKYGKVEVGGMTPYFTTVPPIEEIDAAAAKQMQFLVEASGLLPEPGFAETKVKDVGGGMWEVELRLQNTAYLPTHLAMAQQLDFPAWVVRVGVDKERRVGGRAVERIQNLPGSGGSAAVRWLIAGRAGELIEFTAYNRVFGEIRTAVTLRETEQKGTTR
jgi:hypothetical protein